MTSETVRYFANRQTLMLIIKTNILRVKDLPRGQTRSQIKFLHIRDFASCYQIITSGLRDNTETRGHFTKRVLIKCGPRKNTSIWRSSPESSRFRPVLRRLTGKTQTGKLLMIHVSVRAGTLRSHTDRRKPKSRKAIIIKKKNRSEGVRFRGPSSRRDGAGKLFSNEPELKD